MHPLFSVSLFFRFLVLLVQSYCKIFEPPNVFAIIFAELVKIDKIYRPGRKTKSRGAEKLVFRLEKLSFLCPPRAARRKHTLGFLNCNRNRNRRVAAGVCCMFLGRGWLRLRLQLEIPHPTFCEKGEREIYYIYIYIYIVLPILPLSPQNAPSENLTVTVTVTTRALFSRFAICGAPTIALRKKNIAKHLHIPNTFTNFADATPKRREAPHDDNRNAKT